jgi:carbonic anhydrase
MSDVLAEMLAHNTEHARAFASRFDEVQESQHPDVVTVCCSDSRVLQDHIWGNDEPGEVFTVGNIGNRVVQWTDGRECVSGDVLYPLVHTDTGTAVVVGHTGCGAVTATYDAVTEGLDEPCGIEHCVELLRDNIAEGVERLPSDLARSEAVNHLVEYNVDRQVEFLLDADEVPEDVTVVGAVYDFQDVYGGQRGEAHVVNVDGTRTATDADDLTGRIDRLWTY